MQKIRKKTGSGLSVPQRITNTTQQTVWAADYQPFGQATLTTALISNPLRFPGQYYDEETGLHYNYFRDYDPGTGRYMQSDPIGLGGGLNTYGYVGGNPVGFTDPTGENLVVKKVVVKLLDKLKIQIDGLRFNDKGEGKICQVRYKKKPVFRLDYKAYPGTNNEPKTHFHMAPNMKKNIPLPKILGGEGIGR